MTEPFEASYDQDPSYEWDYRQEDRGPRILWGRVIALGVILILAFILGRSTASQGGVSDEQLETLRSEIADLEEANELLQAELDAANATDTEPTTEPSASPTEAAEPEGTTYVVERRDTLQEIAIDFYGDPDLDECIAEANDIADPTQLSVGMELFIPDESACI